MPTRLNRHAYEQLIREDIEWLMHQPPSLEREHILAVLRCSPDREYPREGDRRLYRRTACSLLLTFFALCLLAALLNLAFYLIFGT